MSNSTLKTVECSICEGPFESSGATRCAPCVNLLRREAYATAKAAKPVALAVCANPDCGVQFRPRRSGHVLCTKECGFRVAYQRNSKNPAWVQRHRADSVAYHIENRRKKNEQSARWRSENAERHASLTRAWRDRNLERDRLATAEWAKRNPDRRASYQRRRRAHKLNTVIVPVTRTALEAKLAYWGGCCWMCGGAFEAWDHVKPLAATGPDMLSNLRPACRPCNSRKGPKWFGVHSLSQFRESKPA